MITAIDTNVLLDILAPNEEFYASSAATLENAANEGSLVVCDVVYAELCVHFRARRECDEFLNSNEIRVESLTRDALFLASRAWRTYRQQGGTRPRILPDFLIGAHASTQASHLLTRDRGFYRRLFRGLALIDPSISARARKS
jgi:predicted nucleic acid-binding protein